MRLTGLRLSSIPSLLLRICLLAPLAWYLFCSLVPAGNGSVTADISFPPGTGIKKLASDLQQAGVIRSRWHFMLTARLKGAARQLKAGDYRISNAMTPGSIIAKIAAGQVDYRRFTLPEGYSIYQAAELLAQKQIFSSDEFLAACRNRDLLKQHGIAGESAEGYLYPATYNLSLDQTPLQLVNQMVLRFRKAYGTAGEGTAGKGLSQHQVVTLASIIEKEAVVPQERPLIASVFHNRLRIGMPLQSDPTAVYGVRAFSGKVSGSDLEHKSPYNTYLVKGLPPGPIGNPSADAIRAALNPTQSTYLYFVARKDGTHYFSNSLDEHNRAVYRYLKQK